ncbi:MAG: sigma 54-interacting transcriptional regulator, partial [Polyangiales bacterium]
HVQSTVAVGIDRQARAIDDLELALDRDFGALAGTKSSAALEALEATRDTVELLDTATSAALGELGRVEGELAQIVASTFAERERARAIATTLAGLEAVHDVDELLNGLARGIQELIGANAVVMAERVPYVGLRPLVMRGMQQNDDSWIAEVEAALDTPVSGASSPPSLRETTVTIENERDRRGGSERPTGPVLVVPVRGAGTEGAIFADKRASGGSFSATDRAALELLASYSGVALARLRAQHASESLGRRLAATMDAMRDGLLAVDTKGFITALNEPAARSLRVDPAKVLGRRLADVAELQPIAASLALTDRPDGSVVRTQHTSLLVNARAVEGEGIVATLIEYERAQRIAQKLAGPRARYTLADLRGKDPSLLEAELFGYERGAFTGARAEGSIGKFEQAGDGTILLDEIVDLPLDMQAKLLRVLQERVVVRLGSSVERPVRARVMATAQRDLTIDVEKGRFRLDLLHRLRVLQVQLPALRHRPGDISILARHYIRLFAERQGKAVRDLAPDVEQAFVAYGWPGNVRELANVIEGEVSLLGPEAVLLERVPSSIARARTSDPPLSG